MRYLSCLLLVVFALAPACSWAGACTVTTTGMGFGVYSPLVPAPLDGISNVQLSCEAGIVFTMKTSTAKMNPDGSREMKAGGGAGTRAIYFLYIDPARTQIWGDGTGNTYTVTGTSTGAVIDVPIYGRVPALQALGVGSYRDKVLVRVNF